MSMGMAGLVGGVCVGSRGAHQRESSRGLFSSEFHDGESECLIGAFGGVPHSSGGALALDMLWAKKCHGLRPQVNRKIGVKEDLLH